MLLGNYFKKANEKKKKKSLCTLQQLLTRLINLFTISKSGSMWFV